MYKYTGIHWEAPILLLQRGRLANTLKHVIGIVSCGGGVLLRGISKGIPKIDFPGINPAISVIKRGFIVIKLLL